MPVKSRLQPFEQFTLPRQLNLLLFDTSLLFPPDQQQQRNDLQVLDGLGAVLLVPLHQFRHHLVDFLRVLAVVHRLWLDLVTAGHRTQPREIARRITQSANVLLVAYRRSDRAELPVGPHHHTCPQQRRASDPGEEHRGLSGADTGDPVPAGIDPGMSDVNVAVAREGLLPALKPSAMSLLPFMVVNAPASTAKLLRPRVFVSSV